MSNMHVCVFVMIEENVCYSNWGSSTNLVASF